MKSLHAKWSTGEKYVKKWKHYPSRVKTRTRKNAKRCQQPAKEEKGKLDDENGRIKAQ